MNLGIKTRHDEKSHSIWWETIEDRIDEIYKVIITEKGKRLKILDLGCGDGINIFRWHFINNQASYIGVDFDKKSIAHAKTVSKKNSLKNLNFIYMNILDEEILKLSEEKFDIILCSEIFEHLYDEEKVKLMNNINYLLKNNGYLIITTPTTDSIPRNIYESDNKLLIKLNNFIFKNSYEDRILTDFKGGRHHHVGVCNKKYYHKLAYRKGFEIIKVWPSSIAMGAGMPKIILQIANIIFVKMNPFGKKYSTNLIYLYKKVSDKIIDY
jgi:2-polyprenyl-3-methyl-5-hydroxy-6-metoxy-1,4-benzoquinol methylase